MIMEVEVRTSTLLRYNEKGPVEKPEKTERKVLSVVVGEKQKGKKRRKRCN